MPTQENLKEESTQIGTRLLNTVREYLDKSNTMSERMFKSLFGRMQDADISQEEQDILSAKYRDRFGPYEGVRIVNDEGTLVRTIPPLFKRLKPINKMEGIKDPETVARILSIQRDTPQNKLLQTQMIDALINITDVGDDPTPTSTANSTPEVAGGFED